MTEVSFKDEVLTISISDLLEKYKQNSGYSVAKQKVERGEIASMDDHVGFDDDMYICHVLHDIVVDLQPFSVKLPLPPTLNVYTGFRNAIPQMFKSLHASQFEHDYRFIFDWLKKDFRIAVEACADCPTESRIMLLKMIKTLSSDATLSIVYPVRDEY